MLSIHETVQQTGGVARGRDLQRHGFSRNALSRLVIRGEIQRLRNGVFGVIDLDADIRTAAQHGGALSCASALRRAGVWVLDEAEQLHVWVGSGRHSLEHDDCRCIEHFYAGNPPLTSTNLVTALLHYRKCGGDEALFAAIESAWHQGLLTRADQLRIRDGLPRNAHWMLTLARRDAESGLESLLRLRVHLMGYTLKTQQVTPGIGRADFRIDDLIIEVDGKENHEGPTKRHKDLVRDAASSALGRESCGLITRRSFTIGRRCNQRSRVL